MPMYSHFMNNAFQYNPSWSGSDGYSEVSLTAREQWVGIPGAPRYHSLGAHGQTKVFRTLLRKLGLNVKESQNRNVGIGGLLYQDKFGLLARTGGQVAYAYHITLKKNQISFGLALNAYQLKLNRDNALLVDDIEPALLSAAANSVFIPDASFGVSIRNKNYFAGFSVNSIFQSALKAGDASFPDYRLLRHYYLIGGLNIYKGDLTLKPSILIKTTEQFNPKTDLQADISCIAYYKQRVWAGLTYRTNGEIITLIGASVKSMHLGYAFDCPTNKIISNSFGSHEIFLSYRFGGIGRRYNTSNRY